MKKSKFIDYNVILAVLSHRNKKQVEALDDLAGKLTGADITVISRADQTGTPIPVHGSYDIGRRA
jgi:hypothetical protein